MHSSFKFLVLASLLLIISIFSMAQTNKTDMPDKWEGVYKHQNGVLTITEETDKTFKYTLEVSYPTGMGTIDGTAKKLSSGSAVHSLDCDKGGKIKFIKKRNRISVDESGCAVFEHGAGATFDGYYYK